MGRAETVKTGYAPRARFHGPRAQLWHPQAAYFGRRELPDQKEEFVMRCPDCGNCPCTCTNSATVTSIGIHRFANTDDAAKCNPRDALEAAIAYLDHTNDKPDHIIVLFGRTPEGGGSATKWFQAGSYEYHAQIGLLHEGGNMIRENG
jgi:hypothetical protein